MISASQIKKELQKLANPDIAEHSQRFFKTGKGEYGEDDKFLGIRVPEQRKIAKKYKNTALEEVKKLLHSPFHEERLTALLILVYQYPKSPPEDQKNIYEFYMKNLDWINNWDLIDITAPHIAGNWLLDKPRDILYRLAKSERLWDRRIAIIATFHFIRNGDFNDTFKICNILISDTHDLIHKATGWMLREIGKQNEQLLVDYLKPRYKTMPRTMLRYAIEKFPEPERQKFLNGTY